LPIADSRNKMARQAEKLTLSWLIKHPLVATCILLALTIALPYLRVGERLKLLAFLPVAHAAQGTLLSCPSALHL
jgi:hypothetical protein